MEKPHKLIDKAFILKKSTLFESLDLELLLTIADKVEMLNLKKGSKVFQVGNEGNQLYLIVNGSISIHLPRRNRDPLILNEGEFFGDESIFNERTRGYEAIAEKDSTLLAIQRSHVLSMISECPAIAVTLLQAYSDSVEFRTRATL